MPAARTHDKIAVISGLIMVPVSAATWLSLDASATDATLNTAVLVGSHLACSYWLSPDLDLNSSIDDRWGPLRFIWVPYAKAMPHRHWLSHSGISVLLRLAYLLIPLAFVLLLLTLVVDQAFQRAVAWLTDMVVAYPLWFGLFLLGAIISDAIHTITDQLVTGHLRVLRRLPLLRRLRRSRRSRGISRSRRR